MYTYDEKSEVTRCRPGMGTTGSRCETRYVAPHMVRKLVGGSVRLRATAAGGRGETAKCGIDEAGDVILRHVIDLVISW